jgi:hypothetical protein
MEARMKTISTDKPNSWLQLPVSLRGCKDPDLHLTVKYFGRAQINPVVVAAKIKHDILKPGDFRSPIEWTPTTFSDLFYVLELTKYPMVLAWMHSHFTLIADQFPPWRPHITVNKEYWAWVRDTKANPVSENLQFGEPELYLGYRS